MDEYERKGEDVAKKMFRNKMEIVFVKAISPAAIHRAKQYGSTKLVF
jgi:hypothetical protein